jgi:exopolyphosphatase/guanosine-5'-triphosphate,3'-diphosphate pyrophosphatase
MNAFQSDAAKRDQIYAAGRAAVVDIGSNSVRLVIYEGPARAPMVDYNEKAMCGLGRGLATTGMLHEDGVESAIAALARFRIVAERHRVKWIEAVATAAVRDARNGGIFRARASDALGARVRVLSGEEEAAAAAGGVIAGIGDADGLVGDLGGGSLEIVPVSKGLIGEGKTLPFGPLQLMERSGGRMDRARALVDEGLEDISFDRLKGKTLYAVGGVWRSIASIHMRKTKHPVKVLHHYAIARDAAIEHAEYLAGRSRKSIEDISGETRRRSETIPFGAIVLERLLRASRLERVVVSAYGLREGVLFQRLAEDIRRQDPLLSVARDVAHRAARETQLEDVLVAWTAPLFPGEDAEQARLRRTACILSDVAWRGHPDHRASGIYWQALHGNWTGIDHRGRAFLALALYRRYAGPDESPPGDARLSEYLGPDAVSRANILGCGLRLAYAFAGACADVIAQTSLRVTPAQAIVTVPRALEPLYCDAVVKKFDELADALGKTPRCDVK